MHLRTGLHAAAGGWRHGLAVVVIGVALGFAVLHAVVSHALMNRLLILLHYNDFGKFYYAAQEWRSGGSLYGANPATAIPFGGGRVEEFLNLNPPHFHFLVLPLSHLAIERAYAFWAALNVAAALASLRAIATVVNPRPSAASWAVGLALAAASAPALAWAATGQVTGLLMACTTAFWLAVRRGRWVRAGFVIGLACSIKIFLAPLMLYLALKRQWAAASVAVAAAVLPFVLGLVAFGVEAHEEWIAAIRGIRWTGAVMNASLQGLLGRTWSVDAIVTAPLVDGVSAVVALCLLAVASWSALRAADRDAATLVLLVTALLASPLGWVYYVPITAGPLVLLLVSRRLSPWVYVSLAGLMVPFTLLYPYSSRAFALTLGSTYSWSLLVIWIAALRAARTGGHQVSADTPASAGQR